MARTATWSAVLWLGFVSWLGCGSRNDLLASGPGGSGGGGASSGSSSSSSSSGGGAGGDAEPPPPCTYAPAGDATVAMAFDDRHVSSPSLAVIEPGQGEELARVALQGMASSGSSPAHPDVRLSALRVGEAWPGDLVQTQPPVLAGDESHSWAEMARAPGGRPELALSWYSDPGMVGRLALRRFDIPSWSPGPKIDIDFEGEVALALAPGAAVGEMGIGYAGEGYALVWRRSVAPGWSQPLVGVLDLDGQLVLGPHPVAAPAEGSGRSPVAAWSGEAYLMATAFSTCEDGDPLCAPNSVVVTRLRPASGDAWDDSGIDLQTTLANAKRPTLASHQGRVWLAWLEIEGEQMLLAELAADGTLLQPPTEVASGAMPIHRPTLVASEQGLALVWLELSGDDGPPDQPGYADVVVLALDRERAPLAAPLRLPITAPQLGIASAAVTRHPRSLLVTWSGAQIGAAGGGLDRAYLARFDCLVGG